MNKSSPVKKLSKAGIFLVDDHPILREGLVRLINQETDMVVCGQAPDAAQALETLPALKPDLCIIDISLADTDGFDLIRAIRARSRGMSILVLSMHNESLYAERVLRAGAKGYIMKREPPEQVIAAIRKVLKGDIYLSEHMSSRLLGQMAGRPAHLEGSPLRQLSDRELTIFELLGSGHATRQIADALHLSIKTVESYREHIKEKLHLQNAMELAQHAFEWVRNGSER